MGLLFVTDRVCYLRKAEDGRRNGSASVRTGERARKASTKMPRNKSQSTSQENAEVSTDVNDLSIAGVDADDQMSLVEQLRKQLAETSRERDELKAKKTRAPREPREPKAAAPARTLESVIAAQHEKPYLYALKRIVVATRARMQVGQDREQALHEVTHMYEMVARDILQEMEQAGENVRDAESHIVAHLDANYPKVLAGHQRGAKKSSTEDSAEEE